MAKDRKKLQHIHSSVPDRQPTPATLEVGEIAVNGAKDQEFLSIKNTEDKVVRFSSDGQLIEWIERKEVMPYEGFTRGSEGPTGSTGPDSVTNDDLLQNKSNIIIKLNQVAADNTVKHDKVNGAKDIYNKPVNPTTDYGVSDGAGFAIDMSRYAMIDANPSFSSLTVTVQTDLSGNTTISDGAGTNEYGTDSGHTLTIKTTDVIATDTNWTETITNQNSTITTLNESATTRITKIGTENLNVSGTTTIDRKGDVSENNQGNVTLVTSGATTETKEGNVTETNLANKVENTSGTSTENIANDKIVNISGETHITITGNTAIHTDNELGISAIDDIVESSEANITITANEDICETAGANASFYAVDKTNLGLNCDDSASSTTTNLYGETINENASTANTTIGTAVTEIASAETTINTATSTIGTATTVITNAEISATTASLSGNTLVIEEATSISAKTPTTELSGTTLIITETNATINSCGSVDVNTNALTIEECEEGSGNITINENDIDVNGDTFEVVETTVISLEAPTVNVSGTSVNISGETTISGNTTIGGDLTIDIPCTGITSTTVNEALCELLNRGEVTMEVVTPTAESEILKTYKLFQNGVQIGDDINIPKDHLLKSAEIVYGTLEGDTFTSCSTVANTCHWYIKLVWNVFDPSTGHADDKTTYMPADDFIKDIADSNPSGVVADSYNNVAVDVWYDGEKNLVSATTTPTIHASQNIYADGTVSGSTVSATTGNVTILNAGATTISGATTINNTLTVTGNTNISGATTIDNTLTVNDTLDAKSGLSKTLSWTYGDVSSATSGSTNFKDDKSFVIPQNVSNLNRGSLTITHNGLTDTFDPATSTSMTMPHSALTIQYGTNVSGRSSSTTYNTSATNTVDIPTAVSHLTRGTLTIQRNGTDLGTFDATGNQTINISVPTSTSAITNDLKYLKWTTGTPSADTTGYNGSNEKTITIPSNIDNLTNFDGNNTVTIGHDLKVSGTVTATGAIYSSDLSLKENINPASYEKASAANNVPIKEFYFKSDPSRKVYGVIAQEVEAYGLGEVVVTGEDGLKGVDYTSLMLLKISYLENEIKSLRARLEALENKN